MKVELTAGKDLLLVPETDFEETFLNNLSPNEEPHRTFMTFLKYGSSMSDFRGLCLKDITENKTNKNQEV